MISCSIKTIEDWVAKRCDGKWEQRYGIRIINSDNPGWIVEVESPDELPRLEVPREVQISSTKLK